VLSIENIRTLCSGLIGISEPLAPMTSFRIGGPADIYVEPMSATELTALIRYFRGLDLSYIVLGNGSNILVHDDGYRGAAINLERGFSALRLDEGVIEAGAGVKLARFVDFCVRNERAGTEMLAGIPGTLGGAVIMNAGAYGGEISDHIVDVTVLRAGNVVTLAKDACGFRYRDSDLRDTVVLSARFRLPSGDPDALRGKRKELLLKRNAAQPTQLPNAGSIFKNPPGRHAAKLIEECGLKGCHVGGAEVSPRHANFIVNAANASSTDVLALINHIRATVAAMQAVRLELEILLIGFPPDALAPVAIPEDGASRQGGEA
jgi:UDP-N-acetylmuramate dehydrogenase